MAQTLTPTHVAIIGAGYAGISAAVELSRADIPVSVFDASTVLGGRARVEFSHGQQLSNSVHTLWGCYTETLRLLRFLGVSPKQLHTLPFSIQQPGRMRWQLSNAPAPLHLSLGLLQAEGLGLQDKIAAMRLYWDLRRRRYQFRQDISVAELMNTTRQTAILRELVWEPLCLQLLKTPAERASAQLFANMLKATLLAGHSHAEQIFPRIDLSELLPVPATMYLNRQGSSVRTASPIRSIEINQGAFELKGADLGTTRYSHVIVATAPQQAIKLLGALTELTLLREQISQLRTEGITTTYLHYAEGVRLPQPIIQPAGGIIHGLYDLSQLGYGASNTIAALAVAHEPGVLQSEEEWSLAAHKSIERFIPKLPAPLASRVIQEKEASFSAAPGINRPRTITPIRNLLLAGDYVESEYPSCIEGAVCSGLTAAQHIVRSLT